MTGAGLQLDGVLLWATSIAIVMLAVAMLLNLARLLRGPGVADRILALDTLYINSLALLMLCGIRFTEPAFFDAALLIGLLGFVGTTAFAKYLLRGDIID